MSLRDDIESTLNKIAVSQWNIRSGRKVPDQSEISLGNEGVELNATVLYADLANSTDLVRDYNRWVVAEISKAFLACSVRIIRHHDGTITSFDGDRVMAVFHGKRQNSDATRAALKINYVVKKMIRPEFASRYDIPENRISHCVGIDCTNLLTTRSGIRDNNDLVWVGKAANYAAVLSDERTSYSTYMTYRVYKRLADDAKYANGQNMWTPCTVDIKYYDVTCYGSSYYWKI